MKRRELQWVPKLSEKRLKKNGLWLSSGRKTANLRNCFIDREKPWLYQKILQKYRRNGCVANIPGRGRKEILSATAKKDYTLSKEKSTVKRPETCIIDIIRNWKNFSETVRRVIHNAGFHGRTQYESHSLITSIEKETIFCKGTHFKAGIILENTVIFSDESKFNLYRSDGQYKVWRQVGKGTGF
ncbi:hypothetical protein TNCV_3650221 [Trichonephila clavipes]|nr:hypothetical protein TNCV_3650221 [Trichonephila clavipes]